MEVSQCERIKQEMLGGGLTDHNGCSWLCSYQGTQGRAEAIVDAEEKKILQKLAQKVAQIAELPIQEERRKLWTDHHDLKLTRPPIFIDPEYAWYELIPHTVLQCKNNLARMWEYRLRKEIYWHEVIGDDRVCTKDLPVTYVHSVTSMGLDPKQTRSSQVDGAGQFSVRGGILDVYPPCCDNPVRIEFWGDDIDSISFFEPETQRRTDNIDYAEITPACEILYNPLKFVQL